MDVQLGELVTLEPGCHQYVACSQLLRGEHCFVLMGTRHGSAISMAKIAAIKTSGLRVAMGQPTEILTGVDYMVSVRSVLGAYMKRPELFNAPVAWLFSSDLDDAWCDIIQQRISTVLRHLHIELKIGQDYSCSGTSWLTFSPDHSCSVTATCHPERLCDVYVEECLAAPIVKSGVLNVGTEP